MINLGVLQLTPWYDERHQNHIGSKNMDDRGDVDSCSGFCPDPLRPLTNVKITSMSLCGIQWLCERSSFTAGLLLSWRKCGVTLADFLVSLELMHLHTEWLTDKAFGLEYKVTSEVFTETVKIYITFAVFPANQSSGNNIGMFTVIVRVEMNKSVSFECHLTCC